MDEISPNLTKPATGSGDRLKQLINETQTPYFLASFVDSADDGMIGLTLDGLIVTWNPAAERLYGYTLDQMLGKSIALLATPEGKEEFLQNLAQLWKGEKNWHFETTCFTNQGRRVVVELSVSPVKNSQGEIVGATIISRDISEKERNWQQHLEESERRQQVLFDQAPDPCYILDEKGYFVQVNKKGYEVLGYEVQDLVGKPLDLIDPGFGTRDNQNNFLAYPCPGETISLQTLHRHKDGTLIPVELHLTAIEMDGKVHLFGIARDQRDRKKGEEALWRSEELFRIIFEHAPIGISQVDLDGHFREINPRYCEILGYSREEILELNYQEITPPEDLVLDREPARQLLAGEITSFKLEKRNITKDGSIIWINLLVSLARTLEGKPDYFISVVEDITGRKELTRAIMESESRYRLLAENSSDIIAMVNLEGIVTYVSPACLPILGYAPQEIVGHSFKEWLHPDEVREIGELGEDYIIPPGFSTMVVRSRRKDGSYIWVEATQKVVRDSQTGKAVYLLGMARDVTARRRIEERFSRTFLASPVGITITTLEGVFLEVNPKYLSIFGYSREEMIGHSVSELGLWYNPQEREEIIALLLSGQPVQNRQVKLRDRLGELKDILISLEILELEGQECLLAILQDITERKKTEEALKKSQEQLLHSQKMEAVGRLAGGVAHDFNNLLTGILGYADMALNELSSQHPIYGYLKEIKKAGERAAGLTRQLLTFSRRQVLQLKALDLNEIVAEMDQMLRRLIGEDIELLTLPDPHLKRIKADPGQLEQVLLNLAINSRDAMPRGGALTIWTENVELDDTYSKTHPELRPGKYIMLMVSDTGEGMDKGTLSHIFEPFFTTKEQGKGTGLGLSTVYGIVEQCGGHIWVYSEKGLGTVFKIYFPVVEEEPDNQTRVEEKKGEEFGEYTVLLVEDEEMVQGLVKKILENNGMRVLVAGNGAEALALTRQYEGRIDLVLTDLVMPRMGGGELANRLREVAREVKVLFMSGYNREQLGGPEADLYEPLISKPFTAASLLTKVRELLVG